MTPHASSTTAALRKLFEDSPALVALLDGSSQVYLFANAAYRAAFFSGNDPFGRTVAQMLPEADTQGFVKIIADVFTTGQPFQAEEIRFDLALPGGGAKVFYFNLIFKPVQNDDGCIDSTLIVATDVTETVANRETARQSKRQLQTALESGGMGAWRIELATGLLDTDVTFRALHHVVADENVEDAIARIGHPDDQQRVRDALARTVAQDVPYDVEYRVLLPEGGARWIAARGDAVHDDTGRMTAVSGVAWDIGQRKADELAQAAARARDAFLLELDATLRACTGDAALQESTTRLLGQRIDGARIFYSEIDSDGGQACVRRQYGVAGAPPLDGVYDLRAFPACLHALQAGQVVMSNVRAAAWLAPGEQAALAALQVGALLSIPILVSGKLVASLSAARGQPRQWTDDDKFLMQATAERTWPGVLQARNDAAAREAARRKDEFLAMLAHELRNPLAPISAAAQLLQSGASDTARVLHASQIIDRQVRHMTGLVDDLLDVSRVTTGMIALDQVPLDVAQVLHDAVEQATPLLRARRHHLQLDIAPDETLVTGDRKRLVQVFANLVGNAAKYTPEGGRIAIATRLHATHVLVDIRDNGIGMAPELQARAFDLFAQAERASDRSLGGLGLGLALVKSLVELHQGTVTCTSAGTGCGSVFTVCLPRTAAVAAEVAPDSATPAGSTTPAPATAGLRILVVDDNVDAAAMLAMLLEVAGHDVAIEHGARRALVRAQAEAPQVCLLDIGLPDMDGNELARRLRAEPVTAGALLVAVTGYGQQSDQDQSLAAGFDFHFLKPVDVPRLRDVLAEFAATRAVPTGE